MITYRRGGEGVARDALRSFLMEGLSSIHRRGAAPSPARGEKRGRDGSDLNNIIVKLHVMCIIYT